MRKSRVALILASLILITVVFWEIFSVSSSSWITNTVIAQPSSGSIPKVQLRRLDSDLIVELENFPSFRSQFQQPKISTNKDGSVTVSLESSSTGWVSNKNEQLTNISMKLPSKNIPAQSRVFFRSNDYDQTFVSGIAP